MRLEGLIHQLIVTGGIIQVDVFIVEIIGAGLVIGTSQLGTRLIAKDFPSVLEIVFVAEIEIMTSIVLVRRLAVVVAVEHTSLERVLRIVLVTSCEKPMHLQQAQRQRKESFSFYSIEELLVRTVGGDMIIAVCDVGDVHEIAVELHITVRVRTDRGRFRAGIEG